MLLLKLKPADKMIVISLLKSSELDDHFCKRIGDIASEYSIKTKTVSALLRQLVSEGYLHVEQVYQGRGSGCREYKFTDAMKSYALSEPLIWWALNSGSDFPGVKYIVENRYSCAHQKNDGGKSGLMLTAPQRLMLLTFLKIWDETGSELGYVEVSANEICQQMGIRGDRFKSLIKKLKDWGIFQKVVSGQSNRQLFGKTKTRYYFNRSHELFGELIDSSCLVVNLNGEFDDCVQTEASALLSMSGLFNWDEVAEQKNRIALAENPDEARKEQQKLSELQYELSKVRFSSHAQVIANGLGFLSFRHLFENVTSHDRLQLWMCDIASAILTHSWDSIDKLDGNTMVTDLLSWESVFPKSMVINDVQKKQAMLLCRRVLQQTKQLILFENEPEMSESLRLYGNLIQLGLYVSAMMARRYKSFLMLTYGYDFLPDKVAIVPTHGFGERISRFEIRYAHPTLQRRTELVISNAVSVEGSALKRKDEGDVIYTDVNLYSWESIAQKVLRGHSDLHPEFDGLKKRNTKK
ncbi:hypothetical protein VCRA2113O117_70085 [Vibrio crassostreae]|nr:hypothetical protein VCRA2110O113_100104 [Vibrio crassostreae]CAK2573640.1 hypothetical protein VCRA2119O125_100104 [Vibrio crassostreae]CAK3046719.1 hypothetical protein VCRA2113O117_70085 [Vibrio crassostreae]CAK3127752.1 hypothetical protein VCRA2122O129_100086 [Vibrio crassostreae]